MSDLNLKVEDVERGLEDRNRTSPFPFCGNRWEFRAVGSSQNVGQPTAYLNTITAYGLSTISDKIESGLSPRDAIAATFEVCQQLRELNRQLILYQLLMLFSLEICLYC
jgi:glutamine synthetase type III